MSVPIFADAGAQSTVLSSITSSQTTLLLQSATGFPSIPSGARLSVVILDSGNPSYVAASPLATPYEYQPVTSISGNTLTLGGGTRAAFAGTTPHAYFGGATVAAVLLAEDLAAANGLYRARAHQSTNGTVVNNTWTSVAFNVADYDFNSNFNTSNGVYTAPLAGVYRVSSGVIFNSGGGTIRGIRIVKVTTTMASSQAPPGTNTGANISTEFQAAAGDTIYTQIIQDSGGSITAFGGLDQLWTTISLESIA